MSTNREQPVGDGDSAVRAIAAYLGGYYALEKQQLFIFELFYPANAFKAAMKEVYNTIVSTPGMTPEKALKDIFDAFNRVAEKNAWLPLRQSAQQPVVACLFRILNDSETQKYSLAALRSLDSRSRDRLMKNMAKFGVLEGQSFVFDEVKATRYQGTQSILRSLGNPEPTQTHTISAVQGQEKVVTPPRKDLMESIKYLQAVLKLDSSDKEFAKILSRVGQVKFSAMKMEHSQSRNELKSDLARFLRSNKGAGRLQNDQIQSKKVEAAIKALENFLPGLTREIEEKTQVSTNDVHTPTTGRK